MVVGYCRNGLLSAFLSLLYTFLLFKYAVTTPIIKEPKLGKETVLKNQNYIVENVEREQPSYRRHRRKLPLESNDQLNQLDTDDGSLQEYQGVFGRPGIDFPVLSSIPLTKFNCRQVKNSNTGYYADLETHCQVFHVCDGGQKISFLCPNGTIFHQSHLICDWWFRVECERSPELYEQSVQQLVADQKVYKKRVEAIANAMQHALTSNGGVNKPAMLESPISATPVENFNSVTELPAPKNNFDTGSAVIYAHNQRISIKPQNKNTVAPPKSKHVADFTPSSMRPTSRYQQQQSNTFSTLTTASYNVPDATPLTHNFLHQNESGGGGDFRENQILAETAAFAGNGSNPNYYFDDLGNVRNKFNEVTFTEPPSSVAEYSTAPSYGDPLLDELKTTIFPDNFLDEFSNNTIKVNLDDNDTYALYFASMNGAAQPFYVNTTIPATTNDDFQTDRATPKTAYFDNYSAKPAVSEFLLNSRTTNSEQRTSGGGVTENTFNEHTIPVLLTNSTKSGYDQLFEAGKDTQRQSNDTSNVENVKNDLTSEHSSGLVQSHSESQKSKQRETPNERLKFRNPDLRELAQVFSRALSAYLENPEQFRRILSEVRPTEPPINADAVIAVNEEVLAFSDDNERRSTPSAPPVADVVRSTPRTIENPETFAEEINNFMFSDPYRGFDSGEFNVNETYYPTTTAAMLTSEKYATTIYPLPDYTSSDDKTSATFNNFEFVATTLPADIGVPTKKGNLYEDADKNSDKYYIDANNENADSEQLFIAADTQSFLSRDNLIKSQNSNFVKNRAPNQNSNPNFVESDGTTPPPPPPTTRNSDSNLVNVQAQSKNTKARLVVESRGPNQNSNSNHVKNRAQNQNSNPNFVESDGTTPPPPPTRNSDSNLVNVQAQSKNTKARLVVESRGPNQNSNSNHVKNQAQTRNSKANLVENRAQSRTFKSIVVSDQTLYGNSITNANAANNFDYNGVKSSKHSQFGMRTTPIITRSPFVSSRSDSNAFTTAAMDTTSRNKISISTDRSTAYTTNKRPNQFGVQPAETSKSHYTPPTTPFERVTFDPSANLNETSTKALVNMMQEAKTNNMLRQQLVLLLVHDNSLPLENKSVKDMKAKLLRALLKPAAAAAAQDKSDSTKRKTEKSGTRTENSIAQKNRKENSAVLANKSKIPNATTPANRFSTDYYRTTPIRDERSTLKPIAEKTMKSSLEELTESDSRAVDLLKTLYAIASNNWSK